MISLLLYLRYHGEESKYDIINDIKGETKSKDYWHISWKVS